MNYFNKITHAKLKDCFVDEDGTVIFVVSENEFGRAVGKKGAKSKKLESTIKRKIKIVEFNSDIDRFIRNYVYPIKIKSVSTEDRIVTIEAKDSKSRGLLIGRSATNLHNLERTVKRYFEIDRIQIPSIGGY